MSLEKKKDLIRQIQIFILYNKNPEDSAGEILFDMGVILSKGNRLERAVKFIRYKFPELYYSQMRAAGKLTKLGGEIELIGVIFYMADRETGKITKEKREVFIGLCFGNKLITRDYITSALQLIKKSSVGVREEFLTFTNGVSLETVIKRLEQAVPPLGNA